MFFVDVSAAVHSRAGLGRYSQHLAQALAEQRPGEIGLFYNRGQEARVPASLQHLPRRSIQMGYKPWRLMVLLGQTFRIYFDRYFEDARLFHSTEHLLLPLRTVPTVLTVHDLIYKLFPAYHKRLNYWYLNLAMPLFCRRADAIIAISESSKRDIVKQYGVPPDKVHVVYEAAADHFQPPSAPQVAAVRRQYELPDQYLIHLGTIEPRKNLVRLLDALVALRRDFPQLHLVLAGAKGWLYEDFFAHIERVGLKDAVHVLGWVPDSDLPAVIAGARLAVQPSLYEGFGLPLLEHMGSGQVVAASHASSLPEVGGDAAAYFDPENVSEMVGVVGRLLSDPEEYAHRRTLGREQAARFSWERTAQETLKVYEHVLEQ